MINRIEQARYIGACEGLADFLIHQKSSPESEHIAAELLLRCTAALRKAEAVELSPLAVAKLPETQIESALRIVEASK